MLEIFFSAFLYTSIGLAVLVMSIQKLNIQVLLQAVAACFILTTLAVINFELDIVAQKFASEFAFNRFSGNESVRDSSGFVLQAIYCWPAFALTNVWWAAIGTNIAAVVLLYAYIAHYNTRLSLFVFAPVIVNFSLFSLRDPLIGILMFTAAVAVSEQNFSKRAVKQGVMTVPLFFIRPENILIILGSFTYSFLYKYLKTFWALIIIPITLIISYALLKMVPGFLNISFSGSILDLPLALEEFYTRRANRHLGSSGGNSNILDGQLSSMPFILRYPIQVISLFLLPLPVDLKSGALLLAAIDSIFFIALAVIFHRSGTLNSKILFWAYILMVALFISNYGNAFRLRLPAYMIMMGGLLKK